MITKLTAIRVYKEHRFIHEIWDNGGELCSTLYEDYDVNNWESKNKARFVRFDYYEKSGTIENIIEILKEDEPTFVSWAETFLQYPIDKPYEANFNIHRKESNTIGEIFENAPMPVNELIERFNKIFEAK
jgi:hypothetical protein